MFRVHLHRRGTSRQGKPLAAVFATLLITFAIVVGWTPTGLILTAEPQSARLSLEDVIKMVAAGESEEAVVLRIKNGKRAFDLTDEERRELGRKGVSDTIIKYLLNPELPYAPPPPVLPSSPSTPAAPPRAAAPELIFPDDPYASKVPSGVGAYLLQKSDLVPISVQSLLPERQGGILSKMTLGLTAKTIGVLSGPASRVRLETTPAVFYLRLADPMKIEDVTIVSLEVAAKDKRRELEFAPSQEKGGKPAVKINSIRQSDRIAVGPKLYRVATTMLETGEFMFYLVGSADPANGILGKGYDFGVN